MRLWANQDVMSLLAWISMHNGVKWLLLSLFSLIMGSFGAMLVYRLPKIIGRQATGFSRFNVFLPASHCPHCKKKLRIWHNIPLLGYGLLRGRCYFCNQAIAADYFWIELGVWGIAAWAAVGFGWGWMALWMATGAYLLWLVVWIDCRHYLIPNVLSYPLAMSAFVGAWWCLPYAWPDAILGGILGFVLLWLPYYGYLRWRGVLGLGLGDCKLMLGLGGYLAAWHGLIAVPYTVLWACVLAILHGIFRYGRMHLSLDGHHSLGQVKLAFAPHLVLSTLVVGWVLHVT